MIVGERIETYVAEVVRLDEVRVRKTFLKPVQQYSTQVMFDNEVGALKHVQHLEGMQQLLEVDFPHITTKYCGTELPKSTLGQRSNITQQLDGFATQLKTVDMMHRDILPRNILHQDGQLTLIDFTWAFYPGCCFTNINDAPSGLGGRWNPKSGFSNEYSINIIKKSLSQKT